MALTKYIKQPLSANLASYTDAELRKIESSISASTLLLGSIEELATMDIEVGVFIPEIVGLTTPGVGTYSSQFGQYLKMGRLVIAQFNVSTTAHTGTGRASMNKLPFVVRNANGNGHFGANFYSATSAVALALAAPGSRNVDFYTANPAGALNIVNAMNFLGSVVYVTDD